MTFRTCAHTLAALFRTTDLGYSPLHRFAIRHSLQELVEKETTQTEVLHMEVRSTGEFAHRETTRFEQLETFNSEVRWIDSIHRLDIDMISM